MSKLDIENIIKNKVGDYTVSLPENSWSDFESKLELSGKSLSGSSGATSIISSTALKITLIAALVIVPIVGIYLLKDFDKEQRNKLFNKHKNNVEETIIEQEKPIIEENSGNDIKEKELENNIETHESVKEKVYVFKPYNNGNQVYFGPTEANKENITKFRMLIRDKKGKLIFESNNQNILWNGKIKGEDRYAKDGMYDWFIIIIDSDDEVYRRHGKVKLEKQ